MSQAIRKTQALLNHPVILSAGGAQFPCIPRG
jgi:hypothetical protein